MHLQQEVLGEVGYPFSTLQFHPLTYITQNELKTRANSLAYAKYKLIKREMARKAAKRKLMLIMCIVKCKAFINKLKARVEARRAEKKRIEEELKQKESKRKRIKENLKLLDKSVDDSLISQQVSGFLQPSESSQSIAMFGVANSKQAEHKR